MTSLEQALQEHFKYLLYNDHIKAKQLGTESMIPTDTQMLGVPLESNLISNPLSMTTLLSSFV